MAGVKILVALVLGTAAMACAQEIPGGTALPLRLGWTIDSNKVTAGQAISAFVAQDVPLPSGGKLKSGSRVNGRVLQIGNKLGWGVFMRLRFDQVQTKAQAIPITTSLRALASPREVEEAQLPKTGPVVRDPGANWITVQIGDDVVYRGGGHVMNDAKVVGDPVKDGVMSVLLPVAKPGCEAGSGDRRMAVWVFGSAACGVYGFRFLEVSHAGDKDPVGEIVLQGKKNVKLDAGSGLLLVVTEAPRP